MISDINAQELRSKTPLEVMSAVSEYMWRNGVSEEKITEYSTEVLKAADGDQAVNYTLRFLRG